jgi:transcriptional regulator with XRE-family HTH domain
MLTAIAEELRLARERADLTQEELAEKINFSQSYVSKVERGQQLPSPDFAKKCDEALGLHGQLQRHLRRELQRETMPTWFRPWVDLEREATVLRSYEPCVIPGLLQVEPYARALLQADPGATPDDVEQRVAARMDRQAVLSRCVLVAVLDESALRRPVAEPKVMHDQLTSLLDSSAEIQVIELGAHPGLNGPLVIASLDGTELAYVEGQLGGRVLEGREDLLKITLVWETLRGEALSKRRSRDLILEVAKGWHA